MCTMATKITKSTFGFTLPRLHFRAKLVQITALRENNDRFCVAGRRGGAVMAELKVKRSGVSCRMAVPAGGSSVRLCPVWSGTGSGYQQLAWKTASEITRRVAIFSAVLTSPSTLCLCLCLCLFLLLSLSVCLSVCLSAVCLSLCL